MEATRETFVMKEKNDALIQIWVHWYKESPISVSSEGTESYCIK